MLIATQRTRGRGGWLRRQSASPMRRAVVGQVVPSLLAGSAATLLALLAASAGMRYGPGGWPVIVGLAVVTGVLTAVITRNHVRQRARQRCNEARALVDRLDRLDGIIAVGQDAQEPASAEMLARIAASVRQAELLRQIAEGVHGVEALFDLSGTLRWISPSIEGVTGCTPAECVQAVDAIELLVHESDRGYCRVVAQRVAAHGTPETFEMRLKDRDGVVCWVSCHWQRMVRDGEAVGLRMSAENVQARKETEYKLLEAVAELRRSHALREHYLARSNDERMRLTALLNVIRLGILFMDRDHRVLYYNRAMLDIWGFAADENLIGIRDVVLQSRVAALLEAPEVYFRSIQQVLADDERERSREIRFKDGRIVTDASAVVEGGVGSRGIGRVWIYEDVTEQRRTAERLVQLAERDPLTDLFNRRRFHEELDRLLADASRRNYEIGLLMFDLDGFKPINDQFGHQAGDEVLVTMSQEVGGIIRRNETFFRLGGDEFAVLVPDAHEDALLELARRIVEGVAGLAFRFDGQAASLTASLGIALYPRHADATEGLVAAADDAMYRSKSSGRNRWTIAACRAGESARMARTDHDRPNRKED